MLDMVDVKWTGSISRTNCLLLVLVVIGCPKGVGALTVLHGLGQLVYVVVGVTVEGSEEAPLVSEKLSFVSVRGLLIVTSEGGDLEIKCIHGPRHGVDELGLLLINKVMTFESLFLLGLVNLLILLKAAVNIFVAVLKAALGPTEVNTRLCLSAFYVRCITASLTQLNSSLTAKNFWDLMNLREALYSND